MLKCEQQRRNYRCDDDIINIVGINAVMSEHHIYYRAILVSRSLVVSSKSPALEKSISVEYAQYYIGITYVYGKQHARSPPVS